MTLDKGATDADDIGAHPIADVLLEFTHALTHQAIVSRGLFPSSRARSTLYGARTCVVERQDVSDYLNDVFATLRVALSRYGRLSTTIITHGLTDAPARAVRDAFERIDVVFVKDGAVKESFEFGLRLAKPMPEPTARLRKEICGALTSFATRFVLFSEDARRQTNESFDSFEVVASATKTESAPPKWRVDRDAENKEIGIVGAKETVRVKRVETDAFTLDATLVRARAD